MMPDKTPHPIDRHVGARVRLRRTLVGMSQEQLGAQLGLTFQQVQKYEKGTNRISASRLWEIARILETQVSFFFEGAETDTARGDGLGERDQAELTSFAASTDSLVLLRHYLRIADPAVRRAMVDLARALGDGADADPIESPLPARAVDRSLP